MKRICFALFFLYPVQAVFGGLYQPAVGVAGMGDGMLDGVVAALKEALK